MIVDAIISSVLGLLTGVLALIPTYTFTLPGFGSSIGGAIAGAQSVFPVVTLGLCIVAVVSARLFIAMVAFSGWVWAKIPFTFK